MKSKKGVMAVDKGADKKMTGAQMLADIESDKKQLAGKKKAAPKGKK
jgi:hypothetical protein